MKNMKNMKKDNLLSLKKLSGLENGDSIFFVCDKINEARKFTSPMGLLC